MNHYTSPFLLLPGEIAATPLIVQSSNIRRCRWTVEEPDEGQDARDRLRPLAIAQAMIRGQMARHAVGGVNAFVAALAAMGAY